MKPAQWAVSSHRPQCLIWIKVLGDVFLSLPFEIASLLGSIFLRTSAVALGVHYWKNFWNPIIYLSVIVEAMLTPQYNIKTRIGQNALILDVGFLFI